MTNRLSAEQFGGSNTNTSNKDKYAPMCLDDVMERSLVHVCKEWIGDGKSKDWTLKWMGDRFDLNGKYNVKEIVTDIEMKNIVTGAEKTHTFMNGQLFTLDLYHTIGFTAALSVQVQERNMEDKLDSLPYYSLVNFMAAITNGYKHYVIWRMCRMTSDATENMILGCILKDITDDSGEIKSGHIEVAGIPYPLMGSVLDLLVSTGVLQYADDLVG